MSEEIKPHHLRALASDIEDCHNPQSWVDYCRAAAAMLEIQTGAAAAMLEIQTARIAELEAELAQIKVNWEKYLAAIAEEEAGEDW